MIDFLKKVRPRLALAVFAAAGLAVRWAYVYATRDAAPHPDLGSFLQPALAMTHPFDTSPREPFFVWWLWLLSKAGLTATGTIRAMTALWFLPALWLTHRLAGRYLSPAAVWSVTASYAFLPAQIQSDTVGLRHVLEGVGVLLLLEGLSTAERGGGKGFWNSAAAGAGLILTRISHLGSVGLLLAWAAVQKRRVMLLAALAPGLALLAFHLQNSAARYGDPFHSVNLHTYWFSNLEYIGQPGFPESFEEWQKNPHKPSLTFREWAFERHTPMQFVGETLKGVARCFWIFFEKVYFAQGVPVVVTWALLILYAGGLLTSLARPPARTLPVAFLCFVLPYAFVSHVFWAGRFFAPLTPIALVFVGLAVDEAARRWTFPRRRRL